MGIDLEVEKCQPKKGCKVLSDTKIDKEILCEIGQVDYNRLNTSCNEKIVNKTKDLYKAE